MTELRRRWQLERWISVIRLAAVPWALFEVGVIAQDYPAGHEVAAWSITAALALGAVAFFFIDRRPFGERAQRIICFASLSFNTLVISAYCFVFVFEPGTPIRQLLYFAVIEAALRYGLVGGVVMPLVGAPRPRRNRALSCRPVRAAGVHDRPHHVPARPRAPDGPGRRLARQPAGS